MSTVATSTKQVKIYTPAPSFFGILRGELLKISRQWTTWIMLVLLLGVITLPHMITLTASDIKDRIHADPLHFFYNEMEVSLSVLRVFVGIFLLVLVARVIGLEYQLGTIRVLLARGVGRLQLLFAKLLTVVIIALILFTVGLLLNGIMICAVVAIATGNVQALNALTPDFWSNTELYALSGLISMGVTILLATALSVLGRSLSFGLSASLAWFPVDNIGTVFMVLAFRITHNDFWRNITAYFLGPNLNVMPTVLLPAKIGADSIGSAPLVQVDGMHTLLVSAVYASIFAIAAIVLTWKRDVKE